MAHAPQAVTGEARLVGKVAIITGAASGIGRAIALRAVRAGMKVALIDVEREPLLESLHIVQDLGAAAISAETDVSDPDAVHALAATVEKQLGPPWLVCNNAGVNKFKPFLELTQGDWNWIIGVNLGGVINGVTAFLPGLIARNAGHIVNTASAAGLYVAPGAAPYTASKHAVIGLSESLWRELSESGSDVGVSVVCPRLVATNMLTSERNQPGATAPLAAIDMTKVPALTADPRYSIHTAESLADRIFAAVIARQFWIMPHAEEMRSVVSERFRQALDEENPDDRSTIGRPSLPDPK